MDVDEEHMGDIQELTAAQGDIPSPEKVRSIKDCHSAIELKVTAVNLGQTAFDSISRFASKVDSRQSWPYRGSV